MEEKYYNPLIEEFHEGFEFEYHRYSLKNEGVETWHRYIYEVGTFTEVDGICYLKECIEDKAFRVKLLDKKDIESLGWKKWADRDIFDLGELQLHTDHFSTELIGEPIIIYSREWGMADVVFKGVIKNKSELEKLMSQLGIK